MKNTSFLTNPVLKLKYICFMIKLLYKYRFSKFPIQIGSPNSAGANGRFWGPVGIL